MIKDLISPIEKLPADFCITAKHIWHGKGFFSNQAEWTKNRRMELLESLAKIPSDFDFPIFYSSTERKAHFKDIDVGTASQKEIRDNKADGNETCHTLCFFQCLQIANIWIKDNYPKEMIFIVAENHEQHQKQLTTALDLFNHPLAFDIIRNDPNISWMPLDRIVDSPSFVNKSLKSPTQISDLIAFILSKKLKGDAEIDPLFEIIKPQIAVKFQKEFLLKK